MARKKKSLKTYDDKRDFRRTPEPKAQKPPRKLKGRHLGASTFVVHRHEARRLHYDLRLEMDGVLKCFAIPKGFSYVPEDKHLAVHTEDHPIEYETFEGVIPKGEYGAGTMTIWDSGSYEVTHGTDALTGLEEGKLEIILNGGRLRGEWHLVRTQRGERDWLLFKSRDRYARSSDDPLFPLDLSRHARSAFPKKQKAMEATSSGKPFSNTDWVFELRFVGHRLFAVIDEEKIRFVKRDGALFAHKLRELTRDLRQLRAERAWIDGVLVAMDEHQRPDAKLLDRKIRTKDSSGLVFYAFDILYFDEWDLKPFALVERKRALASIIPQLKTVLYTDHVAERGEDLFEVVQNCGLSGMIAKASNSTYQIGPSKEWRTIAAPKTKGTPKQTVTQTLATVPQRRPKGRVKFSNRDKVYWPTESITKGQLLDYYDEVAEVILPHLRDRPVHMLRYPDGIEGKSFFHKNVTRQLPSWVETVQVGEKDGKPVRYVMCNDRDTLLYLVNLGSIDLHPWMSRRDGLDSPDWAVLDLDPGPAEFSMVVTIARALGKLLHGAGLRPVLKTSGSSGLHIFIPLARDYSYDQARMFSELVARLVVRDHPRDATVERTVDRRRGRVYIDTMQIRRGQTVVAPYVVRPVPGATVSTPLDWDELSRGLNPRELDMYALHDRLNQYGDLFRGAVHDPQDLTPAIETLSQQT